MRRTGFWASLRTQAERLAKALTAAAMTFSAAQAQPQPQPRPAPAPRTAPAPVVRIARPALWRVRDRDTTIYLFGTIHALPDNLHWHTPALDRALAASDEIVMEVSPGDLNGGAMQAMQTLGIGRDLPPILERVPEDRRTRLAQLIAQSGLPPAVFDRLKTWTAAIALIATGFQRMGLASERGIETNLTQIAGNRPATGLETARDQLGFLDSLSEESQRALLVSATDDDAQGRAEFDAMLDAWSRGDPAAIARSFNTDESMTAELRRVLLTERNARWAGWIRERLARPGTVFIAVGAGHLAGEGSVVADLRTSGVPVDRVQ